MDAKSYICPNCGADLKFDPDKQKFCCEFCRSEFTEAEINAMLQQKLEREQDEREERQGTEQNTDDDIYENGRLYECPSCGAQVVADENTAASFCYYCHNPVILKGRVNGKDGPTKVLPFAFGKDKAVDYFNEWTKDKKFVPDDLVSDKQIEKMTGLYVPFWIADAITNTKLTATGEKVRSWTSGDYRYTETKTFAVVRDVDIEYNGVPADGSQKIEDDLMEAIEPFDYTQMKDFDMAYLSGFFADKYDVDKDQIYPRIHQRMFMNNSSAVESSCSYTRLIGKHFENNIVKLRWTYTLMPVWFMTFHYKGKVWEYAINGQTGKIAGELPIDNSKLRRHQFLIGLLITLVILVLGYFLGGLF